MQRCNRLPLLAAPLPAERFEVERYTSKRPAILRAPARPRWRHRRACGSGTHLAPWMHVGAKLVQRLREHESRATDDASFVTRLLELTTEIERSFDGDERSRLLRLAEETFERHLELRSHARSTRASLEQLHAQQRRLVSILEGLRALPEGETFH